jgi:hypothetical protein
MCIVDPTEHATNFVKLIYAGWGRTTTLFTPRQFALSFGAAASTAPPPSTGIQPEGRPRKHLFTGYERNLSTARKVPQSL